MISANKTYNTHNLNDDIRILSVDKEMNYVIYFKADWCGPCHYMEFLLKDLAFDYKNQIVFISVDVDENQKEVKKYGIKQIPSLIFIKGEEEIKRFTGTLEKQELINYIEKVLL